MLVHSVSRPKIPITVASGAEERGGARAQPGHVLIFRHSSRFVLISTIIVMRKSATHDPKSKKCVHAFGCQSTTLSKSWVLCGA